MNSIKSKIRNWILSLILPVIWIILMGSLYYRHSSRTILEMDPKVSMSNANQVILREEWRGIYLNDDKVGYARYTLKEGKGADRMVYEMENETNLSLLLGGTKQNISINGTTTVDKDLSLVGFRFQMKSGNHSTEAVGNFARNRLRIQISGLGGNSSKTITLSQKPYSTEAINLFLLKKGFPLNTKFRLPIFDPSTLSNSEIEIEVVGKEQISIHGENREAYLVEERYKGFVQKAWISDKGEVLKESVSLAGINFTTVSEPKDIAMNFHPANQNTEDLLYTTAVQVTGDIPNPRNTRLLKVKLFGVSPKTFKAFDNRQKPINSTDSTQDYLTLEINSLDLNTFASLSKVPHSDFSSYLAPTPLVQSDDPEIHQQALKIVGPGIERKTASQKLVDWVHKNMKRQLLVSMPSAKDILKDRRGDCNEHATLFAGLARSVGIPTKIVVGIVYVNGGFFYHAWNEVWVGQWIPVDPTFGQTRVDATHIKLFEGDLDQSFLVVQYVGRLHVEILESKASA